MADYPDILSPLHLTVCCLRKLMSDVTCITVRHVHYVSKTNLTTLCPLAQKYIAKIRAGISMGAL